MRSLRLLLFLIWSTTSGGVALARVPVAEPTLTEVMARGMEGSPYRAFTFSAPQSASFGVFRALPLSGLSGSRPLIVYVPGSGCSSNFSIVDGNAVPAWFDKGIRQIAGEAEFVAADRPGVELFAQPRDAGLATDCSAEFARNSDFTQIADGLAKLVDHLVDTRNAPPAYVLVIGASDGAPIAALVAGRSANVSHVAMISGGGDNQLTEFLLMGVNPINGRKEDTSNDRMRGVFEMFSMVMRAADDEVLYGHPARRWRSAFSVSVAEALRKSRAAVYLVGGIDDDAVPVASMDILAAELVRSGKDVVLERIPSADHALRTGPEKSRQRRNVAVQSIIDWARGVPSHGPDVVWPLRKQTE